MLTALVTVAFTEASLSSSESNRMAVKVSKDCSSLVEIVAAMTRSSYAPSILLGFAAR